MLDVFLAILKAMWWLFNTAGMTASMFNLGLVCGIVIGDLKCRYPDFKYTGKASAASITVRMILFMIICSIPFINWMLAYFIHEHEQELISDIVDRAEKEFGLNE